MCLEAQINKNTLFINLDGEIDHHTSTGIRSEIDKLYDSSRISNIIFNFENVTFMDSSGVGLLMGRFRNVTISGGRVALVRVPKEIDKILNISGIYKLMNKFDDEEKALNHLQR
ncbi:anti-sigma F factor antagonist [Candidatus Epulonipiscium viviparus]|uniref:anti-sigma F factor antagonist n=1 Tax=Candidatus Epulonipiscium viviparus TaxID=420336 RepID=UPI00016BFDA0|nr:anti-sigma F factor antagonist [Candidatus Epulopiscium viviparus]